MKIVLLVFGVLFVAFAFNYSKKVGAALLVVIVLGMWLMARNRGML